MGEKVVSLEEQAVGEPLLWLQADLLVTAVVSFGQEQHGYQLLENFYCSYWIWLSVKLEDVQLLYSPEQPRYMAWWLCVFADYMDSQQLTYC